MNRNLIGRLLITGFILAIISTSCFNIGNDEEHTPQRENQLLIEYLARLKQAGHTVDSTASGVYYVVIEPGSGPFPGEGDTLSVTYAGYFVNGGLFDASWFHSVDSAFHMVYKVTPMIQGWNEMMALMNNGKKVEFAIPSKLAYGAQGYGSIPPYTTLVFVAHMADIKPKQE
jgi:FKBP-type peptidyl-prolyl cis-trans isomerase FkpA